MRQTEIKCLTGLICISIAMTGFSSSLAAQRIKTSHKHYTILSFQDKTILCEPYIVQKNDWLYKIFKKKGEISEQDFPFFISIFKQLNPSIDNIDAIAAGARIMIPLKSVNKHDFIPNHDGLVKVPVVEFKDKTTQTSQDLKIKEYTIAPGDTVSALIDRKFLKKGGGITSEGRHLFHQLNPHIKNIHQIHPGDRVWLPIPALPRYAVKPLLFDKTVPVTVTDEQIKYLKQYAATINGRLVHRGKLHFPGRDGGKEVELDLSRTPLIEKGNLNEKILLIPDHRSGGGQLLDEVMRQTIVSYWYQLKIQSVKTVIQQLVKTTRGVHTTDGHLPQSWIGDILSATNFAYFSEETIRFQLNHIPVSVVMDRIIRPDQPDLLLNFGIVYGQGITAIQKAGFDVLSFSVQSSIYDQIDRLLSILGYQVWQDPTFTHKGTVEALTGIYGEKQESRLFISFFSLTPSARSFLDTRQIRYVFLKL